MFGHTKSSSTDSESARNTQEKKIKRRIRWGTVCVVTLAVIRSERDRAGRHALL